MAEILKHGTNLIHSILVDGTTYEIHDAAAIHDIAELNLSGVLKFKGTVATVAELPVNTAEHKNEAGDVYLVTANDAEYVWTEAGEWELFGSTIVNAHIHEVIVKVANEKVSASKLVDAGSVALGTAPSFTEGAFNGGSYTQGEDVFTAGDVKITQADSSIVPCSYTQGKDTFNFNAGTQAALDTAKFDGGKIDVVADQYVAPTYTQGTDNFEFNAGSHTVIDTTKFSAGSMTDGSITDGNVEYTPGTCEQKVENGVLSFICTPGVMKYTAPVYTAPTFVAPKLEEGFYTPGVAPTASFTQGTDSFGAGSFTAGSVTLTPAQIQAGFYTPGTAPSAEFVQGTDTFNAGSVTVGAVTVEYTKPTFTQGTDSFTAATREAATFNPGTATQVTLPTFTTVEGLWKDEKDATVETGLPEAPAN